MDEAALDFLMVCQNPFEKGFRHLLKLFIRFFIRSFWKSRNLFSKRFLVKKADLDWQYKQEDSNGLSGNIAGAAAG
jgi:hypothetical protein